MTGASRKEIGLGRAGRWGALSLSYVSAPQAVLLLSLSTHPTLVLWPLRVCALTISASSWRCCSFLARLLAFAVQLGTPIFSPYPEKLPAWCRCGCVPHPQNRLARWGGRLSARPDSEPEPTPPPFLLLPQPTPSLRTRQRCVLSSMSGIQSRCTIPTGQLPHRCALGRGTFHSSP